MIVLHLSPDQIVSIKKQDVHGDVQWYCEHKDGWVGRYAGIIFKKEEGEK